MKNRNNILTVFLLVSVYCFGIYVHATTSPSFNQQVTENSNNQKANLEASSKTLYTHTQQFENLFSDVAERPLLDLKLQLSAFWNIAYTNSLRHKTTFKQYTTYLKTILIRHRKSDLIFPFHYFW
jgi:hypothetical protein